jgi:hypothetical protein
MKPAARSTHLAAALAAVLGLALPFFSGCENKMEPKECDRIRGEAFELLNKAQHCDADPDCQQSAWPGCEKPLSKATAGQIKPMKESFEKGKCVEPKPDPPCREPPQVYCKQGLCVHREKGTPEGAGNTPSDQIIIK